MLAPASAGRESRRGDDEGAGGSHVENLCRRYHLTRTEARVATLLSEARRVSEIAAVLGVSVHTVRAHLRHLYVKTGVTWQVALVRLVLTGRH
jgi:DNA-binding CsgD family transcriptional regulator